jgi:hypothetical protein
LREYGDIMVIEFCSPPGSGKSSVAKRLYKQGYYQFRQGGRSGIERIFTACQLLSVPFFKVLIKNWVFFKNNVSGLSVKRTFVLSALGAMTYVISKKEGAYIRDQGFFQFGDWIRKGKENDISFISRTLDRIHGKPDLVVFFELPKELSVKKIKKRGDFEVWNSRAVKKGFSNVYERLVFQNNNVHVKHRVCDMMHIPYMRISIDENGHIMAVDHYSFEGLDSEVTHIMEMLESDIKSFWKSGI